MNKYMIFLRPRSKKIKSERGVALLFVVLLTSVLLMVALGIQNIAYKELVFAMEARDSNLAFFAADTGLECGLYLHRVDHNMFASITPHAIPDATHPYTCNGQNPLNISGRVFVGGVSHFALDLGAQCVDVSVDKFTYMAPDPMTGTTPWIVSGATMYYTVITARGYNTKITAPGALQCLPLTGGTPANLVSRVLQVTLEPS